MLLAFAAYVLAWVAVGIPLRVLVAMVPDHLASDGLTRVGGGILGAAVVVQLVLTVVLYRAITRWTGHRRD